ncbi:MAG: SDR family oxidoreductase [Pseudomonadaceae bacterium]|nr:SDR family oxidoreductase [Pseudomonadaceae bacterium]
MTLPVNKLLDLTDQCVLVTGAAGTIGTAAALRLAEAGATVILHYRTESQALKNLLTRLGDKALALHADLTDARQIDQLLDTIISQNMKLTGLINNAADQSVAELAELSLEQWQHTQQTNLNAVFYLTQQACARFPIASVVNISSIEGSDGASGHGHYATSKAGLNMLTRSFALEYGAQNVRCNTISPGLIRREGIERAWPEGVQRWQQNAPLSRLGEGEDIANAALFLLSDASGWISGANLVIDGGMSCQSRW